MCEKRIRKIRRGSQLARLREARRLQRLQTPPSPPTAAEAPSAPAPVPGPAPQTDAEISTHNRVILELAFKTVALMKKNSLIQQKIIALQKETSEFINAIMSNPESKQRYLDHVRLYGAGLTKSQPMEEARNTPLIKIEPQN